MVGVEKYKQGTSSASSVSVKHGGLSRIMTHTSLDGRRAERSQSRRPRRRRRILIAALGGLAFLAALLAAGYYFISITMVDTPTEGNLAGRVTTSSGPIPYAMPGLGGVKVTAEPGGFTTTTARTGAYTMDLPPGVYDVTFSARGREPYSQRVVVMEQAQTLLYAALFPEPKGAPVARLKGPSAKEGPVPYGAGVDFSAAGSKNVSHAGIRWEVRDQAGSLVMNEYTGEPVALTQSPIPGSSPLRFSFTPPAPGTYEVTMILTNSVSQSESRASVEFECVNTPPRAVARTSGPDRVEQGDAVFLEGWGVDENMPSPELYNPGGNAPDTYGKNNDWAQSQFSWEWKLEHVDAAGYRSNVTDQLLMVGTVNAAGASASQRPWFIPSLPGTYVATLTVNDNDLYGRPSTGSASVSVKVMPVGAAYVTDETQCAKCHEREAASKMASAMSCQSCHGPAADHVATKRDADKRSTISVSYDVAVCASCHVEHEQWQLSRHSDGYAFGDLEVARPLRLNCAKCHYPEGFTEAVAQAEQKGISFGEVQFKRPIFPGGPLFFDYSKLPPEGGDGIACLSCHDPHGSTNLRVDTAELCGTCHEEKWQNVLLRETAAQVGSAYEYPGETYPRGNPHSTGQSCVLCHMNGETGSLDAAVAGRIAGHTLRMRDAGPDGLLGGFGPSYVDPSVPRMASTDDVLNIEPCQACHPGAESFDIGGAQSLVFALYTELGDLLREANGGALPGYRPGDKCATCHRGGTLPFNDDPELVLENAYTNYKLIGNDRSWGVHNYNYTVKLLTDSIEAVKATMR